MTISESWQEVGDRVFVRRHVSLDLNCGLVVGEDACLVIDTRLHLREAADLIEAVRRITPHPWTVVNTHAHWDHCFGNAAFRPADIWGHRSAAADLRSSGERQRAAAVMFAQEAGRADIAAHLLAAPIDPPDRLVEEHTELTIGGRIIDLRFLGRGHTDGDLVVNVESGGDGSVLFAGDLVEEGNPPGFDDAFPLDWPGTLGRVHALARGPVVPGHGAVVDAEFVGRQRSDLLALDRVIRETLTGAGRDLAVDGPLPSGSPYNEDITRVALGQARRQRNG